MTGTGVSITLNEEETQLLQGILEERERTLMLEISHADHRDYRLTLQKQAEVVESVLSRLPAQA